jgi:hypothetical protein
MKILALEKETSGVKLDQFTKYLFTEAKKVWSLYQAGFIREMYFRQERSEAVLIMECSSANEANLILEGLPLVQAGLISFDIIPLVPYPGFSRLFTDQ